MSVAPSLGIVSARPVPTAKSRIPQHFSAALRCELSEFTTAAVRSADSLTHFQLLAPHFEEPTASRRLVPVQAGRKHYAPQAWTAPGYQFCFDCGDFTRAACGIESKAMSSNIPTLPERHQGTTFKRASLRARRRMFSAIVCWRRSTVPDVQPLMCGVMTRLVSSLKARLPGWVRGWSGDG